MKQTGISLFVKKVFDKALALTGLVVASPVIALAAIVVRVRLGTPAFFVQMRPGKDGKPFFIYKLRTMTDERDSNGHLLPDEARLSPIGQFLRNSSIDELPQLLNVLKGELSLVGPRPLKMEYLSRYSKDQARRHEVLPGITGWAQINGRNSISWEDKFEHDVWYVDHWSLWLDAKILFLTASSVLRREGVSSEGHVTMPEFMGSPGR